jgi:hypothetical protein
MKTFIRTVEADGHIDTWPYECKWSTGARKRRKKENLTISRLDWSFHYKKGFFYISECPFSIIGPSGDAISVPVMMKCLFKYRERVYQPYSFWNFSRSVTINLTCHLNTDSWLRIIKMGSVQSSAHGHANHPRPLSAESDKGVKCHL